MNKAAYHIKYDDICQDMKNCHAGGWVFGKFSL